ncbi:Calcium-binding mitochondrial carrier protein SCaMC-2 (Small calcium-binding mitochondrial carrier protein 2) (Solute carrier family 25 member 25) [Durusdinium trenchii]|uniref:Calcium-binding mitochondrial carrier protein SCaMC-2 (Small calcium-binding mitochondrial carrier protein 2) (Solute carrier family 25 member 25) n=1 Tax=Durusdinium trenchii TaxID=1381693 RepID=A0ABP0R6Z1_9DINO
MLLAPKKPKRKSSSATQQYIDAAEDYACTNQSQPIRHESVSECRTSMQAEELCMCVAALPMMGCAPGFPMAAPVAYPQTLMPDGFVWPLGRVGAAELIRKFQVDDQGTCDATAFRNALSDLGLDLADERFDSLVNVLDKECIGVSAGQPLAQRPDTQDRDAISEAGDGTARVGDWLPSEDKHGCLTERERRMNSHRRRPVQLEPMTRSDFVMANIKGVLNRRKIRSVEIFRFLDTNGNGGVSPEELARGLHRLGVHKLRDSELEEVVASLDTDRSGDISLTEFDKALRLAEKKARAEGRTDLVDKWKVPPELMLDYGQKYDWSKRTLKFDGRFTGQDDTLSSGKVTSRDIDQSLHSLDFDPDDLEESKTSQWTSKSTLLNASRWLQDNFIFRQRLVDNTWASRPPKIEHERLPLYRYGRFRRAIAETRWGAEPVEVPEAMLKTRDGCLEASRPRRLTDLDRGREKFHAPLLKSVIDTVVFGHDLDFSNDKTCNETFKAKFEGAYGRASWFTSEEDLGSGLFRKAIV